MFQQCILIAHQLGVPNEPRRQVLIESFRKLRKQIKANPVSKQFAIQICPVNAIIDLVLVEKLQDLGFRSSKQRPDEQQIMSSYQWALWRHSAQSFHARAA